MRRVPAAAHTKFSPPWYHSPVPVSEHTLRRRVNFYETDSAGIVHYSNYFRYLEEAEYALWRSAGVVVDSGSEYTFPRVAASFDYHAPLRFGEEFDVRLQIAAIGRTSLRYTCRITRGETAIATGSLTIVCVSKATMQAAPWPEDRIGRIVVVVEG